MALFYRSGRKTSLTLLKKIDKLLMFPDSDRQVSDVTNLAEQRCEIAKMTPRSKFGKF
jgi:hypothetical protein